MVVRGWWLLCYRCYGINFIFAILIGGAQRIFSRDGLSFVVDFLGCDWVAIGGRDSWRFRLALLVWKLRLGILGYS